MYSTTSKLDTTVPLCQYTDLSTTFQECTQEIEKRKVSQLRKETSKHYSRRPVIKSRKKLRSISSRRIPLTSHTSTRYTRLRDEQAKIDRPDHINQQTLLEKMMAEMYKSPQDVPLETYNVYTLGSTCPTPRSPTHTRYGSPIPSRPYSVNSNFSWNGVGNDGRCSSRPSTKLQRGGLRDSITCESRDLFEIFRRLYQHYGTACIPLEEQSLTHHTEHHFETGKPPNTLIWMLY
jgi:hypothetical protein